MLIRGLASLGRWDGSTFIHAEGALYSGDAISDLRTQKNTLSVWYSSTPVEENDAIVAMCLNRSSLDKFVYVVFDEEELDKYNISYELVVGRSEDIIKEGILNQHRDLTNIDYNQMGIIAGIIHDKVISNRAVTKSKKAIAELIIKAVRESKVKYNNRNQVIVESYNFLKVDKPEADLVPESEVIKNQEKVIEDLKSTIVSLKTKELSLLDTITNLRDFKKSACDSKFFQRLIFAFRILFKPKIFDVPR